MRYFALATDYDGTLATHGVVEATTIQALERFRASGRRLVLVTGRILEELQEIFPRLDLFDRVVAENGGVLYAPAAGTIRVLDEPPLPAFLDGLRTRGVDSMSVGHVIVATCQPHQTAVFETIQSLGLQLHVEFNKGAVMVLPAGTTKRSGLAAALEDMRLSAHNVVGVGDAENDHAFLSLCEFAVSVDNALASLKERSDWVTRAEASRGVEELMARILQDDLMGLAGRRVGQRIVVGESSSGECVSLDPYDATVLVAGPSGSGKSTLAIALIEALVTLDYQICVVDPEGDYQEVEPLAALGSSEHAPTVDEVDKLLQEPRRSAVATLLAVPLDERPTWFGGLLVRLQELRAQSGRPHWLVVDEAHHVVPAEREPSTLPLPTRFGGWVMVTVRPPMVSPAVLCDVRIVLTPGQGAEATLREFAEATGRTVPDVPAVEDGAIFWRVGEPSVTVVHVAPARRQHLRHRRKYSQGDVGENKSFYFKGPNGLLNLRAQNLSLFAQIARGIDDATWLFHLRQGDYSRWFRKAIKDDALAQEASEVESGTELSAEESRAKIRAAIDRRYTLPA